MLIHPFVIARAEEGKWVAFQCEKKFPHDAVVELHIGPSIPSNEGMTCFILVFNMSLPTNNTTTVYVVCF